MIFRQLYDLESSTYTYLCGDEQTKKAILIDPVIAQTEIYLQLLEQLGLSLDKALDTHTHADHVTALGELRARTGCTTMMGEQSEADCVSLKFSHDDEISAGNIRLKAIYTPGHTDDSYSFFTQAEGQGYLFTGDTLLIRGTGRTDFQNGSAADQYDSIFSRLLQYPDDTLVYPGHDYKGWTVSTIGEERAHNPRINVEGLAEYIRLMDSLNLPDPKLMDIAVPANKACGANG